MCISVLSDIWMYISWSAGKTQLVSEIKLKKIYPSSIIVQVLNWKISLSNIKYNTRYRANIFFFSLRITFCMKNLQALWKLDLLQLKYISTLFLLFFLLCTAKFFFMPLHWLGFWSNILVAMIEIIYQSVKKKCTCSNLNLWF
jgi:hypothetical protein